MDQSALNQAQARLRKVTEAAAALRQSVQTFDEVQAHWIDLLTAANTIYSKLEQGAKADGKSGAWFGRKKAERKADPLLSYVHHARNSDEHGIAEVVRKSTRGIVASGQRVEARNIVVNADGEIVGGEVNTSGHWAGVQEHFQATLVPVIDRGRQYDPPAAHMGGALPDGAPAAVAAHVEAYLTKMISEASRL